MNRFSTILPLALSSLLALSACGADDAEPAATMGTLGVSVARSTVRLPRTRSIELAVAITRDAMEGDVTIDVSGLPPDVTAQPLTIASGQTTGTLVLAAGESATLLAPATLKVTATSSSGSVEASLSLVVTGIPGQLDESYATGGQQVSGLGVDNYGNGAALDADGKLVLAYYDNAAMALHVRRYDTSGQLDKTFSGDGDVLIASGANVAMDNGQNVIVREDGTILVGYRAGLTANVMGLTPAGDPAPGFGKNASTLSLTNVDLAGTPNYVSLTRDDAGATYVVIAVGTTGRIVKLTSGGVPDPAFATAGTLSTPVLTAYAGAVDDQQRLVIGGMLSDVRTITRLDSGGTLDSSFSGDGKNMISDGGGANFFLQVAMLKDRRIAALGYTGNPIVHIFGDNGELDSSFSNDGQFMVKGTYASLVELEDSLLVATGTNDGTFDIYKLSLTDGSLISSFDGDGIAVIPVGPPGWANIQRALVDAEGRLVLFGNRPTQSGYDFTMTRVWL